MLTPQEAADIAAQWPDHMTIPECMRYVISEYACARRYGNERATLEAIREWRGLVLLARFRAEALA